MRSHNRIFLTLIFPDYQLRPHSRNPRSIVSNKKSNVIACFLGTSVDLVIGAKENSMVYVAIIQ